MKPYLADHPPVRGQFRSGRRARPTGCTVIHTAESVVDTVGPDTGAEGVAGFIVTRTTPGSYHDVVDADSALHLVRYDDEAYQDGTGSNPWALSLSFALSTKDWPGLSPDRRDAFLRQGVVAFRRQQSWLRDNGFPTTPLRRISRAESEAGQAGCISHGERDPARRSDPGVEFPWARFFELCGGKDTLEEDDMFEKSDAERLTRIENAVSALIGVAERPLEVEKRLSARLDSLEAALAGKTEAAARLGAKAALDERLTAARIDLTVSSAQPAPTGTAPPG